MGGIIYFLQGIMNIDISPKWIVVMIFAAILLFSVVVAGIMAKYLLYREEDADLQVIGGIRYGSFIEAMRSGKQGTWPFAKLLMTKDILWIHSPWGTEAWNRGQLPLMRLECSSLNPKLVIHMPEITFFLLPWHCRKVEEAIRMLGYEM